MTKRELKAEINALAAELDDAKARLDELTRLVASMQRDRVRACEHVGGDAFWRMVANRTANFIPPELR